MEMKHTLYDIDHAAILGQYSFMKFESFLKVFACLAACVGGLESMAQNTYVAESARKLPLVADVDVVVVGGSCGAVAAAEAAAKAGARVFLAAPRPYLGDDLAGMLRLWLEPGEEPHMELAKELFLQRDHPLPFTYASDRPSGGLHKDTGAMLCDGRMEDVQRQSVEYDGDVTIHAKMERAPVEAAALELVAFMRKGDFEVATATISLSADGREWSAPRPLEALGTGRGEGILSFGLALESPVSEFKLTVAKGRQAKRILLGQIIVKAAGKGTKVEVPTPLRVKHTLDKCLLDAGVDFLTGSYVTDILRDGSGNPAGVVLANRSGRQAVRARVVIDATDRATVARMAGARFAPYPAGRQLFERVVIAGERPGGAGMRVRELEGDYTAILQPRVNPNAKPGEIVAGRAWLCELGISMPDGSFRSFAAAEQEARDRTFVKSLLDASDSLFQVPPDRQLAPVARVHVVGGCAAATREEAARRLRPLNLMAAGAQIGVVAAREAARLSGSGAVRVAGAPGRPLPGHAVSELLDGFSGPPLGEVESPARVLPVLGSYDVVVVGGGTGGAPCAIGASRAGASTLVIEYLHGLGGVGTLGMSGKYWYGNVCGVTAERDQGLVAQGAVVHVVGKAEWWRRETRQGGGEIWFGTMGCGVVMNGRRVTGVVVATPQGRGVVLAGNVVDATGNSDVAAAAGAETVFQGAEELAVQGAGLSARKLGASYINSDFGYVSDNDAADLWIFGVRARAGAKGSWDISQVTETRERRRIVGDVWVTPLDIVNGRTFPDTIARARSNYDSHGYSIADITYVSEPIAVEGGRLIAEANVPYRALLPKGVDGLAVAGIGLSAHRDAMPIIRMQPDIQNIGYAAGVAAAMAARDGGDFRSIDVAELQRHLITKGCIPEDVPSWHDNAVLPPEKLALAARSLGDGYRGVGLLLAQPQEALPLMREAYAAETRPSAKLIYAHVLGILGDATGVATLIDAVTGKSKPGTLYSAGEKAFGRRMSDHNSFIVALGRTGDKRALAPLLAELGAIGPQAPSARVRSLTLALEALGDPAAAEPLARVLRLPGVGGHAIRDVSKASPQEGFGGGGNERSLVLRELALARALLRCGDHEGLARTTLQTYANDLRGIYAQHAAAVLQAADK